VISAFCDKESTGLVIDSPGILAALLVSVVAAPGRLPSDRARAAGEADVIAAATTPDEGLGGRWGGEHIGLELTAEGGSVEFDCASGEILHGIVPDQNGRFDVAGRYIEEHGGPVRQGAPHADVTVRYSGRVKDGRMKLTVKRSDTKAPLGTFTLERGREPSLVKCR